MRYEFHPEAELELYEAALRYEAEVPDLGRRFGDEVERVVHLLLEHPELDASVDETLRHFVLRKFLFSVVGDEVERVVHLLPIAHGSREPEYWRPRVQDR